MASCHIASVHFAPLHAERRAYRGDYSLPSVEPGFPPAILEIADKIQRDRGPYVSALVKGQRPVVKYEVLGNEIAPDLIREWAESGVWMNTTCHPGCWVVRERIPLTDIQGVPLVDADRGTLWRDCTPDERLLFWEEDLAANREADRAYAEILIIKGNEIDAITDHRDERKRCGISPLMKKAAKTYSPSTRWLHTLVSADVSTCQYCQKQVSGSPIKCPNCHEIIDVARYARMKALEADAIKAYKAEAKIA